MTLRFLYKVRALILAKLNGHKVKHDTVFLTPPPGQTRTGRMQMSDTERGTGHARPPGNQDR